MSSINITVTFDPLAADLYITDRAPYTVSGWFEDPVTKSMVTAEVHGIDPVILVCQLLENFNQQLDDIQNLMAPDFEVEVSAILTDEEYVK